MRDELDKKLCKDFPLLYADRYLSEYRTGMYFGFEVNDGWFQLIYDLSSKLEPLIRSWIISNKNCPEHADDIARGLSWWPRAAQVKEKYGKLRFYMNFDTDEMSDLIRKAEALSGETCEICGQKGTLNSSGWIRCRCSAHK